MSKNKGMPKILWLLVPLAIAKVLYVKKHKMAHKRHGQHCGKGGWRGHHKGWRGHHKGWRGHHKGWRGHHKGWHHKCHGREESAPEKGELI